MTNSIIFCFLFFSFFQPTCTKCDRKFETQKSLNKHERIKHSDLATIYVCGQCQSQLGQACTVKEHYREVHNKRVTSEFVHKLARLETNEEREIREKIANLKKSDKKKVVFEKLHCSQCDTVCTGRSNLNRHLKRHTTQKSPKRLKSNSKAPIPQPPLLSSSLSSTPHTKSHAKSGILSRRDYGRREISRISASSGGTAVNIYTIKTFMKTFIFSRIVVKCSKFDNKLLI